MSYPEYNGIFGYTLEALEDCRNIMGGWDQHHRQNPSPWKSYMSSSEYSNMKELLEVCRKIVDDFDNGQNVFLKSGDDNRNSKIDEDMLDKMVGDANHPHPPNVRIKYM